MEAARIAMPNKISCAAAQFSGHSAHIPKEIDTYGIQIQNNSIMCPQFQSPQIQHAPQSSIWEESVSCIHFLRRRRTEFVLFISFVSNKEEYHIAIINLPTIPSMTYIEHPHQLPT
jgi:hypothetical protein